MAKRDTKRELVRCRIMGRANMLWRYGFFVLTYRCLTAFSFPLLLDICSNSSLCVLNKLRTWLLVDLLCFHSDSTSILLWDLSSSKWIVSYFTVTLFNHRSLRTKMMTLAFEIGPWICLIELLFRQQLALLTRSPSSPHQCFSCSVDNCCLASPSALAALKTTNMVQTYLWV